MPAGSSTRKGNAYPLPPDAPAPRRVRRGGGRLEALAVSAATVLCIVAIGVVGLVVFNTSDPSRGTADARTDARLALSPSSGRAGLTASAAGSNFAPGTVQLAWDGNTAGMPAVPVTTGGSFTVSFVVPATAPAGTHSVSARLTPTAKPARSSFATAAFVVTPVAPVTTPPATPKPPTPTPVTLGFVGDQNVEVTADPSGLGTVEATRYVATSSGSVTSLSIYLDASNRATSFALGLYNDAGGAPGTLLAQGSRSGAQNGSWNTVAVTATPITNGTAYWIARLGTGGGALVSRVSLGAANPDRVDTRSASVLPSTFSPGASYPHITSMYAGNTAPSVQAATPAPTPIPTPTLAPIPTPTPMPTIPPPTTGLYAPIPGCAGGTTVPAGQANPSAEAEPMGEIWCFNTVAGPTTRVVDSRGGWIDDFATHVQMQRLNNGDLGYQVLNAFNGPAGAIRGGTFINNNHWMIDLVDNSIYRLDGGVMLSPNKAFTFENGKLVIEADAAAGEDGAGGADVFYEIDITPAATSTGTVVDSLYGYGQFGGVGAIGCRFERNSAGGNQVCSMYDNSTRTAGGIDVTCAIHPCVTDGRSGRVWETQGVGTAWTAPSVEGGYAGYPIPGTSLNSNDVFRICNTNQMDMFCRDRFRMELTKTSLTIFVNSYQWFKIDGLYASNPGTQCSGCDNRIPDSWFGPGGVHVYFTSWINSGQHYPVRYHWGRLAVNPHDAAGNPLPPSVAPTYCLGQLQNTCAMP